MNKNFPDFPSTTLPSGRQTIFVPNTLYTAVIKNPVLTMPSLTLSGYHFSPIGQLPTMVETPGDALPPGLPWWKDSDYADRQDMVTLMHSSAEWSYAQCRWLELQEGHGEALPGGWQHWYTYAIAHCPRYAKEQPKWRK